MIVAAALVTVAMHASPRMITHRRVGLPRMCAADQECVALYVDVSPAAKSAREHLCTEDAQQKEAMLDTLLVPAGDEAYFSTRHLLVGKGPGKLNSSALLTHDEAHGFYPPLLDLIARGNRLPSSMSCAAWGVHSAPPSRATPL